jgi:hypothetical protein
MNLGVILCNTFVVTKSVGIQKMIIKGEVHKYEYQWSMFGKWLKAKRLSGNSHCCRTCRKDSVLRLYTIDMWGAE